VVGAANFAAAADLLPMPPPPVEVPPPQFPASICAATSGVGIDELSGQSSTFAVSVPYGFENNGSGVGEQAILGLGAGYQFNNWFRADVTGEYRTSSNYWGVESYTPAGLFPSPDCPVICYDKYSADVSSAVFLANGYFDIGTWWGVTPYVGAGVGYAYNLFDGLQDTGIETGGYGTASERGFGSLAWALMAGLSYSVTPNLKLDFGYRYIDMGRVASNPINCVGGCGGNGAESESFQLSSNDVRVGLRYIFAEVPPMAPPLVTKY